MVLLTSHAFFAKIMITVLFFIAVRKGSASSVMLQAIRSRSCCRESGKLTCLHVGDDRADYHNMPPTSNEEFIMPDIRINPSMSYIAAQFPYPRN